MAYICFKRDWWRDNPKYPNGLEPYAGAKSYFKNKVLTLSRKRANSAKSTTKTTTLAAIPARWNLKNLICA